MDSEYCDDDDDGIGCIIPHRNKECWIAHNYLCVKPLNVHCIATEALVIADNFVLLSTPYRF